MSDFVVRTMQEKDKDALQEILYKADPHGREHPAPEMIYRRWGEFYFEESRDNCFVTVHRETDRPVGVILCAADTPGFQKSYNSRYRGRVRKALKEMERNHPGTVKKHKMEYYRSREGSLLNLVHFSRMRRIYRDYPAHLHINIHPDYQRRGLGHLLVDRLLKHLDEESLGGVHLIVSSDNRKGIGFYKKYGFEKLLDIFPAGKSGVIYGLKSREKR